LGTVSYVWIENPVRDRSRVSSKAFWSVLLASGVLIALVAALAWRTGGFPERLPRPLVAIAQMGEDYPRSMDPCFYPADGSRRFTDSCLRGKRGSPAMAILGDSHAAALAPGFDQVLDETGTRTRLLVAAGCPPVADARVMSPLQGHCAAFTTRALQWLEREKGIRVVVLAARWPYAFSHSFYDNGEGGIETGPDDGLGFDAVRNARFATSLARTVDRLVAAGKTVVIIYPVPEPGWDVPKYVVHAYLQGRGSRFPTIDENRWRDRAAASVEMLNNVAREGRTIAIVPADEVCTGAPRFRCRSGGVGTPYYFDDDHPSSLGARVMIDRALRRHGGHRQIADALVRRTP
jgi:hypothetical protein